MVMNQILHIICKICLMMRMGLKIKLCMVE